MVEFDWMAKAQRMARRLGASSRGRPSTHHSVYAILLHDSRREGRWGLYVGQTSRDPDWRVDQHKVGYKASAAVKRFGVRLVRQLTEHLNPMTGWEWLDLESPASLGGRRPLSMAETDLRGNKAEQIRDLDCGQFLGLGPAIGRRPIGVKIGPVQTGSSAVSHALTPLPATAAEDVEALLHADWRQEDSPRPAPETIDANTLLDHIIAQGCVHLPLSRGQKPFYSVLPSGSDEVF